MNNETNTTRREQNKNDSMHLMARLTMMMLEEKGIFISYEEAIKRTTIKTK